MFSKNYITSFIFLGFSYLIFIIALGVIYSNFDYLVLTFFIGGPLFLIFLLASSVKNEILVTYSFFALFGSLMSSYGLFYNRERFILSGGQSTIKHFDFEPFTLVELYIPLLYFHLLVVILFILLVYFFQAGQAVNQFKERTNLDSSYIKSQHSRFYLILLIVFCVLMFFINSFMFNNSVGMGGVANHRLPFKLSGILFYFSRFITPLILLYLVLKVRPSYFVFLLLAALAIFSSMTSLSKAVLILYFFPLLIILFKENKFGLLILSLPIIMISYEAVTLARSVIYLVEDSIVTRNLELDIFSMILQSVDLINFEEINWLNVLFGLGERFGGGQDIVLASQMDIRTVGSNSLNEFFRIYFINNDFALPIASEFYDFTPLNRGIATGDGGFFAHILTISSGNYLIITFLSIFIALFFLFTQASIQTLDNLLLPQEIKIYISIFIILYVFGFAGKLMLAIIINLSILAATQIAFFRNLILKFILK